MFCQYVLLAVLIIFLAVLLHSTVGFGLALVSMPLLTLVIGVQTATPLVGLIGLASEWLIVWHDWQHLDFQASWRLIVASAVGIPLGLLLLKSAPEPLVTGILGGLLIVFGLYRLARPSLITLHRQGWAYLFGFTSGILGGAYNASGPPVVLYGALRRWSPVYFRANIQGYFAAASVLTVTGQGLSGLWTVEVWQLFGLALPLALLAVFLGSKLNRRLPVQHFERVIYGALVVLGVVLLG